MQAGTSVLIHLSIPRISGFPPNKYALYYTPDPFITNRTLRLAVCTPWRRVGLSALLLHDGTSQQYRPGRHSHCASDAVLLSARIASHRIVVDVHENPTIWPRVSWDSWEGGIDGWIDHMKSLFYRLLFGGEGLKAAYNIPGRLY
ncbi:hypothetical protein ACMFMF_009358 [Clarireedia jacksonii]